jgi:hypothetical protein
MSRKKCERALTVFATLSFQLLLVFIVMSLSSPTAVAQRSGGPSGLEVEAQQLKDFIKQPPRVQNRCVWFTSCLRTNLFETTIK